MPTRQTAARAVKLALATALTAAACDGPGNTGIYAPDPNLVRDVPWMNGVLPAMDTPGVAVVPSTPQFPPIGLGLPDPGPGPTDCSTVGNYTFSAGWFDDMEPLNKMDPGAIGVAKGWASYDDLSKFSFHTPGDFTWYGITNLGAAWGLPAERFPGPSCDGTPNEWALHYRGGLFRRWGGGISHAFTDPDGWYRPSTRDVPCHDGNGNPVDLCPPPLAPNAKLDTAGLPTATPVGSELAQSHDFFDVTVGGYDGVAFWARRGPEGFDRVQVILTDKFTSARLARENQTFCRRVRECHTRCLSGSPCSPENPNDPSSIHRCYDPAQGPLPAIMIESQMDQMYPRCGPSACTSPTTYADRDFDGKQCRPYAYPASEESGEYCWSPGDPPPPSRDERCQDGWLASVELTPNWKFHAIPFEKFSQAGFGKRAPYLDLHSLDTLAFGAPMGWADFYIDNVTLYRNKK
jgi:hypothetical protein